ncbi:MAG: UDP-N-acetylglucosamine 2-epimerase (non-hydrolyzing) [Clostridia bacterium]|nr:UDP-N-acetylglucosamine 2-epimerase (non-hydrolyzing) [Clostridia bacterium]
MLSKANSGLTRLKKALAASDGKDPEQQIVRETSEVPASLVKILAVFGTRPEAIKMAPVILRLKQDRRFECKVCVSGQHRELLDGVLKDFSIVPDHDLNVMRDGQGFSEVAGKVMLGLDEYLNAYMPDLILVHGDTATSVAAALCAFYRGIPVAHVEAGLRTGIKTSPYPEELNRQLTSRIADLHFAPTEGAKKNLVDEGIQPERIIVTGNTGIDALRLAGGGAPQKPARPYALVTCHRKENILLHIADIIGAVAAAAAEFGAMDFVYLMHPSPEVRQAVSQTAVPKNFKIIEPVPYKQMLDLIKGCSFLVTDSGGIQEEAPTLGKPVLLTRDTTERPEAVAAGNVMLVGTDPENIISSIRTLITNADVYKAMSQFSTPYGDGHASDVIAAVLAECFSL